MRARSLVLCFHAMSDAWDDALAVRPDALARHVRLLLLGRTGGSAAQAVAAARGVLHATFDDALVSVAEAIPILERLGVPATVFACAAYGDGRTLEVPELGGARFDADGLRTLTWDELRGLHDRGVAIGSHTLNHPHLPELGDSELEAELVDSKRRIESEIGAPCSLLAYPYGGVDPRVRRAAERVGYELAFGLPGTLGDPLDWPRLGLYRRDGVARAAVKASTLRRRLAASGRSAPAHD